MSRGRLTKQELGWLLTQEAKGAAQRLRVGVQGLKVNITVPPSSGGSGGATVPAPPPVFESTDSPSLDATLDALDDAMRVLSTLHGPAAGRGRRGRIDLAALLWEIAPDAHISIEPGSGTEVFGEESELRRMLQILIGHESGAGTSVTIKRDSDDVRVSAVLGPDSSSTSDTERALLSRMALRYGGRYELEGGTETLVLPAEGAEERSEAAQLRKELEEAKKQGEAYARELAQVITNEDFNTSGPASVRAVPGVERFGFMLRFSRGLAGELRSVLAAASRQASSPRVNGNSETEDARWDSVRRGLVRAQDFVGMLATVGELDPNEANGTVELVEAAREAAQTMSGRAARGEVTVRVEAEGPIYVRAAPRATDVLLRELVGHAIAASPRGTEVVLRVESRAPSAGAVVHIDDAGATVPAAAHRALVELEIEPGTYGRPSAVPLYVASEIAVWQNVSLELGDAPGAGVRATISFRRPASKT
jgi:signal transduction histidine kinase